MKSIVLLAAVLVAAMGAVQLPPGHVFHRNDLDISIRAERDGAPFLASLLGHSLEEVSVDVAPRVNFTAVCPTHPTPLAAMPSPLPNSIQSALGNIEALLAVHHKASGLPAPVSASFSYMGAPFWFTNLGGNGTQPTPDTIYRIGSITKVFAVVSLWQAQERGLIGSVDDAINLTEPSFQVRNRFTHEPLTWRMLACQLSGLPREAPCGLVDCDYTNTEMLEILKGVNTMFPAWLRPSYSNLAYGIIGRLLEPAFGMSWEEWTERNIFEPLGMTSSYATYSPDIGSRLAQSWSPSGPTTSLSDIGWVRPAGSIYSTINDMNKFIDAFVMTVKNEDSPILKAASMREMMLPTYLNQDGWTMFAYPFESFFIDSYVVRCKGGNIDNFSALTCAIPELGLSFNGLWAFGMDEFQLGVAVMELIIPAVRGLNAIALPNMRAPPNPTSFTGRFSAIPNSPIGLIEVTYSSNTNQLKLTDPSGSYRLQWVEGNTFSLVPFPGQSFCLQYELLALPGELIVYSDDLSKMQLPGYGQVFYYRVS